MTLPSLNPQQKVIFFCFLYIGRLMWTGIVLNSTILFVPINIHPVMGLIAEDDFTNKNQSQLPKAPELNQLIRRTDVIFSSWVN